MIEEKYMVLSFGDNDYWGCAYKIMENIKGYLDFNDYWDKDDLETYCKKAFNLYVKMQSLNNDILRRCTDRKLTEKEITHIMEKEKYYSDVKVSFFHNRKDIPSYWDNSEHCYINLETGKFSNLQENY